MGLLALVSGTGALPQHLYATLHANGTPPLIACLEGYAPDWVSTADVTEFRIETLGTFIASLLEKDVTTVCFAGAIKRPALEAERIDSATLPYVPRMMQAMQSGDDAALRVVISFFEEAGIEVVGAHEIAPDLLPPAGLLTAHEPDRDDAEEVIRAGEILDALAQADVGQSCVVHMGQALAIEGVFGTDWMLDSLAKRPYGRGGVFYKAPKRGQDRRIDLPTIGPDTVRRAAAAGLDGIAVQAGGVMVLDYAATVAAADAAGIFLWIRRS